MLSDNMSSVAKGVSYSAFFAIPSALLVGLGLLTLISGPSGVSQLVDKLGGVIPAGAQSLLRSSLRNVARSNTGGGVMVVVGLVLAVWSLVGAVQTAIWGLNVAYERSERRSFVRQRVAALLVAVIFTAALVVVFAVLVLAPFMTDWLGRTLGQPTLVSWLWWTLQWPLLLAVLMAAFAGILYLGPDVDHPRFRFITPGAVAAAGLWLLASGLFAIYTARFASYNKTWGSLGAVIVTLTWLWLNSIAILFAAELNAEVERAREIHAGTPPEWTLTARHK
jgi:membrane protein